MWAPVADQKMEMGKKVARPVHPARRPR